MKNITFEELPDAVSKLLYKIENIERLMLSQKESQIPNEKLIPIKEAAIFLNLSVPTVYAYVQKRKIPFMKKGKRLYFSTQELVDWLKSGKIKTSSEIEEVADNQIINKRS